MDNRQWWAAMVVLASVVACTQAAQDTELFGTDTEPDVASFTATDTDAPSFTESESDLETGDTAVLDTGPPVDTAPPVDTGPFEDTGDTGDVFEGWPSTDFIVTWCGDCHPAADGSGHDFGDYADLVKEYDHVYCGVSPVWVEECGDAHEPGHLPRSEDQPSDEDRDRMTLWLANLMPKEDGTNMCDHGYNGHHGSSCRDTGWVDTGSPWGP